VRHQRFDEPAVCAACYCGDVLGQHLDSGRSNLSYGQQLAADRDRVRVKRFHNHVNHFYDRVEHFYDRLHQQFDDDAEYIDVERRFGLRRRQLDGDSDSVEHDRGHA